MHPDHERTVARTAEPVRATYLLRRLLVVAGLIAVGGAIGLAAAGEIPVITSTTGATTGRAVSSGETAASTDVSSPELSSEPAATDDRDPESPTTANPLPDQASRFVAQSPDRVVDTRPGGDPPPPDTTHAIVVPADRTAVALSISVLGSARDGTVLVDGRAGAVEAITIGKPGTTTTNLVFVPVAGEELSVRSTAGGHLVIDVVGSFEASGPTGAGRFVPIDESEVTRLETAIDGRDADIGFGPSVPSDGAAALLVDISADVGSDGGVVRLGQEPEVYDQMLMWAPAPIDNNQRRGLAIIRPGDEDLAALRYEGGSVLTVDIVGYFTNDSAEQDVAGLYVPSGPRQLFAGVLGADEQVELAEIDGAGAAMVTVGSRSGVPGRLGALLVPVDGGTLTVSSDAGIEASVTLLGVFL